MWSGKNGFEVGIRSQSLSFGEREHGALDMAADYELHLEGPNLIAVRQGGVRFDVPEVIVKVGEKLTGNATDPKAVLQYSLERLFPQELTFKGPLILPNAWGAYGPLELTGYRCQDGWLSLEWNKAKSATVARR